MSVATIVLFICYADLFPQENVFNDVRDRVHTKAYKSTYICVDKYNYRIV